MPLYTYVLTYKGATYVAQGRHSNFKGFVSSWLKESTPQIPDDLKRALAHKSYSGAFEEVPNRTHVWRKTVAIEGSDFVVVAVQTEG
jgi:hypothetical protein